jgi:hypothetical protein
MARCGYLMMAEKTALLESHICPGETPAYDASASAL